MSYREPVMQSVDRELNTKGKKNNNGKDGRRRIERIDQDQRKRQNRRVYKE
jgi:hypothetical protein